jgi:hypothetical protein
VGKLAFLTDGAAFDFKFNPRTFTVELDEYFSETCKESINSELSQMLMVEPSLRPSAATLLKKFSDHFWRTQLDNDDGIESPTIFSDEATPSKEVVPADNSQYSDTPQRVPQNITIDSLDSSNSSYVHSVHNSTSNSAGQNTTDSTRDTNNSALATLASLPRLQIPSPLHPVTLVGSELYVNQ